MNNYAVKKINTTNIKTTSDYWDAVRNTPVHYCKGIKELKEYIGGTLHYCRNTKGYIGKNGNISYVAEKIG